MSRPCGTVVKKLVACIPNPKARVQLLTLLLIPARLGRQWMVHQALGEPANHGGVQVEFLSPNMGLTNPDC